MELKDYKEPTVTISLKEYEDLKLVERAIDEGLVIKSMEFSSMNLANGVPKYYYKYALLSQDMAMSEMDKMICMLKNEIRNLEVKNFGLESDYNMERDKLLDVSKMSVSEFRKWRKTQK